MKRFLTTLTAVLLAVLLCCSAAFAAAPTSYYLEEMDADIALPSWEDYYFLYPDMPEDNEDLYYLGLTPEDVNGILIPYGILFDALYYDATHEIAVTVAEDELSAAMFNFKELSELERTAAATAVTAEFEAMGAAVTSIEWVDGGNAVWLALEYTLSNDGGWAYQYTTVYNGMTLSFVASSAYGVELIDEIRNVVADMAIGTVFHYTAPTPEGSGISPDLIRDALSEMGIDLDDLNLNDLQGLDLEALGLTGDELMDLLLSAAGLGGLNWRGVLSSAGRGALIGAGVGVVVVILIIVLLAVTGRKKKVTVQAEVPAAEGTPEE